MLEGILSTIGNTPLVHLAKIFRGDDFKFFAKLEASNPGGSMKDRSALGILQDAMEKGAINPDTIVIESSSGNMGVGLAQVCAYWGLRFICVVDAKTSRQNIEILKAYGAEVEIVTEIDPATGEFLPRRIARLESLLQIHKNSFWPNQYANMSNPLAQRRIMCEIVATLKCDIDFLFVATSTCGTLRGCADYIFENNLRTRLVAVDALGSVIFNSAPAKRLLPGHGASRCPDLFRPGLAHRCIHVSDLDCVIGCRRLLRREAIMAGGSSGGVITAVEQMRSEISWGMTCVAILADRGERYLDTIYSDSWVENHFGDVSSRWLLDS